MGCGPDRGASRLLFLMHAPAPAAEKAKSHLEVPLEENLNRRVSEEGSLEARTVEDAIAVLRWDCRESREKARLEPAVLARGASKPWDPGTGPFFGPQ